MGSGAPGSSILEKTEELTDGPSEGCRRSQIQQMAAGDGRASSVSHTALQQHALFPDGHLILPPDQYQRRLVDLFEALEGW